METAAKKEITDENDEVFVDTEPTEEFTFEKKIEEKVEGLFLNLKPSKSRPNSNSSLQSLGPRSCLSSPFRHFSFSAPFITTTSVSSYKDSLTPPPLRMSSLNFLGQIYRTTLEKLNRNKTHKKLDETKGDFCDAEETTPV